MNSKTPEAELSDKVLQWLDSPQSHLDDQTRRRVLELIVTNHVAKVRMADKARARSKDFLLFVSVLTLIGSMWPKISTFLGM